MTELRHQVLESERRRLARDDVRVTIRLVDREQRPLAGELINLSASGFMAELDRAIAERAPVRVELPGVGWVRATAIWVLGRRAGFAFREPINPHDYLRLLAACPQPERSNATFASRSNR